MEYVAGESVILESDFSDVAVLFVGHVHIHDEVWGPGQLIFDDTHFELGVAFEYAAEHHLGDGPAGPVVLGGPESGCAGHGSIVGKGPDARGSRAG